MVKVMLWLAIIVSGWILFSPFARENGSRPLTEQVNFPVADLQAGEVQIVEWLNRPLVIAHRTDEQEALIEAADAVLYRDAYSRTSVQPDFAENALRSGTSNWFVSLGLGTGMGCALVYKPPSEPPSNELFVGNKWNGGFVDGCDNTYYDLAGRVYVDQSARLNLPIPNWALIEGQIILKPQ
ncbi:hypothetical protein AB833_14370 [Chromatiales bacterium (ex Bugula neritina AB1)]|nr:hypothetical protein AB833_14370 [Chromatiales bacterium (ex Bugula neritina AB1)]